MTLEARAVSVEFAARDGRIARALDEVNLTVGPAAGSELDF